MDKKNKINDLYKYQPSNPLDPKMPSLKTDLSEYITNTNDKESDSFKFNDVLNNEGETLSNNFKKSNQNTKQPILIKDLSIQTSDQNITNNGADNNVINLDSENFKLAANTVMPDPNSQNSLLKKTTSKRIYGEILSYKNVKQKMIDLRKDVRKVLLKDEIEQIVKKFKHRIIKISTKSVIIKEKKYGYEFYKNNTDGRYWVAALKFEEPFNPKDKQYLTFWRGNSFIGYGLKTLTECLNKAEELFTTGVTGNVFSRDYVINWLEEKKRFITAGEPKSFTWKEYQKIINWYKLNKIWIHVKEQKVKDYEDIMEEIKQKKLKGELISPLLTLQTKLIDPPRKAINIYAYPVNKPEYKGDEYVKPENKLYQIAFSFT